MERDHGGSDLDAPAAAGPVAIVSHSDDGAAASRGLAGGGHGGDPMAVEAAWTSAERRMRALVARVADGIAVLDAEGLITYVSPSLCAALDISEDAAVGRLASVFVESVDSSRMRDVLSTSSRPSEVGPIEMHLRRPDGDLVRFEGYRTDLLDDPDVAGVVWNFRDLSATQVLDEALRRSEAQYRTIVETAGEGIWIHDRAGRTTFANPKMASLLGTTVAALHRRSVFAFAEPADRPAVAERIRQGLAGHSESYETVLGRADGTRIDALVSASPLRDRDDTVTGVLRMVTDISDRKQADAEMVRRALEDSLTGLASRALVLDRISRILANRQPGLAAVLFMDVDDFKQVNDSLGHDAGDRLLRVIAERICGAVRPGDTVGRFGGDEFVVVLDDLSSMEEVVAVAERICDALRTPVTFDGREILTSVSIGIAVTPAVDTAALMRDADTAMYRAKERGGGRHELFDPALRAKAVARLELESDLRAGIADDQISVHYQPVMALGGHVMGLEALARWEHPTRGEVAPSEFIPLAEATGLIVEVGARILDEACRDLARWRRQPGRSALTVAVNLSGRQLAEPGVPAMVATILAAHGLEPSALCLEITESVLADDAKAATATLEAIHDLGVRLAVDDFGTGYSSLIYLRRFPVDALKLDGVFIAGMETNAEDPAIVRAVIDLAHSLGLAAVAEGVETQGQLDALRVMGCDFAQGLYWSPAVSAEAVDTLLAPVALGPVEAPARRLPRTTAFERPAAARAPAAAGPIPVLLVDDDTGGERSQLCRQLESDGSFEVVGATGGSSVERMAGVEPALVLLGTALPGGDALATLPVLARLAPQTPVVLLSDFIPPVLRARAAAAGVAAAFEKTMPYDSVVQELRNLARPATSPGVLGREADPVHALQIYDEEAALAASVSEYLVSAIREGGTGLAVVTLEHRLAIEALMEEAGVVVEEAREAGTFVTLDAEHTMNLLMVDGQLDAGRFDSVIGAVVRRLLGQGRPVSVFGEVVALLWNNGHIVEALELEGQWDRFIREVAFSLLCAYPLRSMTTGDHADAVRQVLHVHTAVGGERSGAECRAPRADGPPGPPPAVSR